MLRRLLIVCLTSILLITACTGDVRSAEVQEAIESGVSYARNGDPDQAIAEYDRAIELDPDFADTYYNRGNAYYDKGELDQAIADFQKALRISSDPYLRQFAEENLESLEVNP